MRHTASYVFLPIEYYYLNLSLIDAKFNKTLSQKPVYLTGY